MTIVAIRKKLADYMQVAGDKKIKAIYALVEDEIEQEEMEYTDGFKEELDKRYAYYNNGGKMINADIVEGIKKMFPHKTVDITIQSADDTDYILSNPTFAQELQERIVEYQTNKLVIAVKADELL